MRVGGALFASGEADQAQNDEHGRTKEAKRGTQPAVTQSLDAVVSDTRTDENGENGTGGVDRLLRQGQTSHDREHHSEAGEVEPERRPITGTSADADFTEKPSETTKEKKAVGKGVHRRENDSVWGSFKQGLPDV